MTTITEQKHNRPPQEFIDARNDILNNISTYMNLQDVYISVDGSNIYEFTIDGDPKTYLFSTLENKTMIEDLRKEKKDFDSWLNQKCYNIAAISILHKR